MAIVNGFDTAGVLSVAREYAPNIITQVLNGSDFVQTIGEQNFVNDISDERAFSKVIATVDAEPYTGRISSDMAGNGFSLSQRKLKVWPGQTAFDFDPEELRRTWLSKEGRVAIDKGELPLEAFWIQEGISKLIATLNDTAFYKADTTLVSPSPKMKKIFDGLEKDLLACITEGSIVPYTTSAWSEGSGSGNSATPGNIVTQLTAMDESQFTVAQRNLPRKYFVSDALFKKYKRDYSRHYPNFNESISLMDKEKAYLPDTMGKAEIVRCTWLGTSNRVIASLDGAIKVGTSNENFNLFGIQPDDFIIRFLYKIVFGVKIIDPESVKCNSLS